MEVKTNQKQNKAIAMMHRKSSDFEYILEKIIFGNYYRKCIHTYIHTYIHVNILQNIGIPKKEMLAVIDKQTDKSIFAVLEGFTYVVTCKMLLCVKIILRKKVS